MPSVTSTNRGPLVNVVEWIIIGPMCLVAGTKIYTKWDTLRRLQLDDFIMMISVLLAISQSVATSEEVRNGLGRPQSFLSADQVDLFYLCQYVAELLYVVTIFTAKLIGFSFFLTLAGPFQEAVVLKGIIYFTITWTLITMLVVCFQCHVPKPWLHDGRSCADMSAFWVANAIIDIITQLLVSFFPAYLLRNLKVGKSQKFVSMFAFVPNLLTIPITIARLIYMFDSQSSTNFTWDAFNFVLTTAMHALLSVLFAGVPFAKPLVDSMVLLPQYITDDTLTGVDPNNSYASTRYTAPESTRIKLRRLSTDPKSLLESLTLWPKTGTADKDDMIDTISEAPDEGYSHNHNTGSMSHDQILPDTRRPEWD